MQDIDFQFSNVEFSLVGDKAVEHSMVRGVLIGVGVYWLEE